MIFYYFLFLYTNKNSIQKNNNICEFKDLKKNNYRNFVRLNFLIGGKEKEIIMKINVLKRMYVFIRILYNKYHLNVLLHNKDVYDPNNI